MKKQGFKFMHINQNLIRQKMIRLLTHVSVLLGWRVNEENATSSSCLMT